MPSPPPQPGPKPAAESFEPGLDVVLQALLPVRGPGSGQHEVLQQKNCRCNHRWRGTRLSVIEVVRTAVVEDSRGVSGLARVPMRLDRRPTDYTEFGTMRT